MVKIKKRVNNRLVNILLSFLLLVIILATTSPNHAFAQSQVLPEYVIQYGDTLWDIAIQFNTTIDEINAVNGRTAGDFLSVGDRLKIPGLEGLRGTLTSTFVPLGANLFSISRRTQADPSNLIRLNQITSPSELFVGRKIIITTNEMTQSMTTLPSLLTNQSWVELSLLNGKNPWELSRINQLKDPEQAIPLEAYYTYSENDSQNNLAIPGINSFVINNLPLFQGSTFSMIVESQEQIDITVEIAGTKLVFFPVESGKLVGLGGVHALTKPGAYPLTVEVKSANGSVYRFDQWVIIGSGFFETDATLKVDPSTIDNENVTKEDAVFQDIVSKHTSVQQWNGVFLYPIKGTGCVNSDFGSRRTYNDVDRIYYHTGIDLGYCYGIDVFAPAKGTVVAVLPEQIVRGNVIVIDHGLGVFSIYMHLKDILVKEGDTVEPGQLIAHIGNTGRSNGPHLHFEIDINGTPVNPVIWFNSTFP